VDERLRQPDTLPVTMREVPDLLRERLSEAADLDDGSRALAKADLAQFYQGATAAP